MQAQKFFLGVLYKYINDEEGMRINSLNNLKFGYNKDYHEKLHQKLALIKKDAPIAHSLMETDKLCLSIEDKINSMEQNEESVKSSIFTELSEYLVDMRLLLAQHFDINFPDLNYPDELANQYHEEYENAHTQEAKYWRDDLCDSLSLISGSDDDSFLGADDNDVSEDSQSVDSQKGAKKPNFLEEFSPQKSSPIGFSDVVGFENQKREIAESIIDYVKNPELIELDKNEYGISLPRGYLFYGPPGCGKTFLAEAIASETGLKMYKMDLSKVGLIYTNGTATNIEKVFSFLKSKAKSEGQPVLLFMDEVDSFAGKRGDSDNSREDAKSVTTLLKHIQEARDNGIIVIAATNRYDILDQAFKSRFDNQQYFGLPDKDQIKALVANSLSKRTKGKALSQNDEELSNLAEKLKGYSNRSIVFIVDESAKIAKRNSRSDITSSDVEAAIKKCDFEKVDESLYKKAEKKKTAKLGFN